jgi:hypothetical protein
MATPVEFPEQNHVLGKPKDWTDEQCASLPCFINEEQVVSCWLLSQEECEEIGRTGRVYIGVFAPAGNGTPPVWIQGTNPFKAD